MPVTLKTGKLKYKNSQGQYVDIGAVGIPNPIDDTAGVGDTDKVWSADKAASEISDKQDKPSTQGTTGQVLSLDSNLSPVWATPSGGGTSMLVPNIWWNTYENKYVCSETYGNIAQAVQEQRCCFGTFEDTDILYLMDRSLYGIRFVKTSVGTNGINSCEFYIANDNEITRTDLGFGIGSVIAGIEEHTTASRAYSVGDLFLWYYEGDGTFLYKATESIAVGDELESEVNCTQVTIAEELADLKTYVDNAIPSVPVQDVQINGTSILSSGVANVPLGSGSSVGVVKGGTGIGITNAGQMYLIGASSANAKSGTIDTKPIVPNIQHESTFYGLAKVAGADMALSSNTVGTYTDEAKEKICRMLGIPFWKSIELSASDYDSDLGMFILDVGDGNEIAEVRFVGQIVYDTEVSNSTFGAGFGNVQNRNTYNEFARKIVSPSLNRMMIEGEGKNMIFSSDKRAQFGYGYYGNSANSAHAINVDARGSLPMEGSGTSIYNNFNNPRYFHITAPTGVSWAYFYIEYALR